VKHSIPRKRTVRVSAKIVVSEYMQKIAREKTIILGILKKYGKWIMECLYKSLYLNVNGWRTHKVLRWMIMGSPLLTWEMWVIKMNLGFSLQVLYKFFTYLIPKMRRDIVVSRIQRVVRVTMWRIKKNTTNVMRFLSLWIQKRKNIIETKISYNNVIPYTHTASEEKLVHV
jgi:hypothetical protein